MQIQLKLLCLTTLLLLANVWAAEKQPAEVVDPLIDTLAVETLVVAPGESLVEARDAARVWHSSNPAETFIIHLKSGTHHLIDPLLLDSRDGYTRWVGEADTVISGGILLSNISVSATGDWRVPLPDGPLPEQLYVNDQWAQIARWPLPDAEKPMLPLVRLDHQTDGEIKGLSNHSILHLLNVPEAPLPKSGFTVAVMKDWALFRQRVVNAEGSALELASPTRFRAIEGQKNRHNTMAATERIKRFNCWFEGHPEFIARPGDWAVDAMTRELVYRPRAGEKVSQTQLVIPRTSSLINIVGTAEAPVVNLYFSQFAIRHVAYHLHPHGYDGAQAAQRHIMIPEDENRKLFDVAGEAAFSAWFWRQGSLRDIQFTCIGGHGPRFATGCRDIILAGCVIRDCGGNGVMIGSTHDVDGAAQVRGITVTDSLIERVGHICAGAVGVWQGLAADCEISHNRIRDLSYTGISMGWQWSNEPTMAENNKVIGNHISSVMLLLGDGGGIYTLGNQPGSMVKGNYIHDIQRSPLNGASDNNGIYPDQGSSGIAYTENVVHDTASSPVRFHAKGGLNVDMTKNILVPARNQSAGQLSPPYKKRLLFWNSTETITKQVRWADNLILTSEEWQRQHKLLLENRVFGPRPPWKERFRARHGKH